MGDQGKGLDSGLSGLKDEEQGKAFQHREQHAQTPQRRQQVQGMSWCGGGRVRDGKGTRDGRWE